MNKWYSGEGKNSDVVVGATVRLARNLADAPFPIRMNNEIRRNTVKKIFAAVKNSPYAGEFDLVDLSAVSSAQAYAYAEQQLISRRFARQKDQSAFLLSKDGSASVMLCEEDHIRLQVRAAGQDLEGAYAKADKLDDALLERLPIAFDERLVSRCLRVIRQAQPERPFLLLVMGKRWRTAAMEAAIVEKYKGIVVSIPDVMVTTKDGFAWAYGYSWEWLRQGMPVHARTGESLPTGAMWEDLWISVTDEREIVFSCSRGGGEVKEFMRFSYREEKRFFSRQRAAAGQDSTKPAYKMLFLYVMNPDKACLDKELLKRAGIGNEAEARSDLRKVLVERLPQLAERDPFAKKRGKSRQGMYRRFQVVPCKSYIRPLELMLSLERKPERHR